MVCNIVLRSAEDYDIRFLVMWEVDDSRLAGRKGAKLGMKSHRSRSAMILRSTSPARRLAQHEPLLRLIWKSRFFFCLESYVYTREHILFHGYLPWSAPSSAQEKVCCSLCHTDRLEAGPKFCFFLFISTTVQKLAYAGISHN